MPSLAARTPEDEFGSFALSLLDAMDAATCAVDASGLIVAVNRAWREFAVDNEGEAARTGVGLSYFDVCAAAGDALADQVTSGLRQVLDGVTERIEVEYPCHGPDEQRWFSLRVSPLPDGGAVLVHVDVSVAKRAEIALAHETTHDGLTNLPNRHLLHDRLTEALSGAGRGDNQVGVAFLDVDHFKRVNESLGHSAGDALLVAASERLRAKLRTTDTLARFAGDEFVVVWPEVASTAEAEDLAERLRSAFDEPFEVEGEMLDVSASIGVAVGGAPEAAGELLLAADVAMYDAKTHGRGRARMYRRELRAASDSRMRIERELREALQEGQFVLHYQPVVDLRRGVVQGVEALVRWQHPDGLRMPDAFIPVAETTGLIVPLGAWVLEESCRQAAEWAAAGLQLDIAVNLSVRQVSHPGVLSTIQGALQGNGLDPSRLLLEVTESAVMEDAEQAQAALAAIAGIGAAIAIDDFGTGYSSLLYLKRYPIQVLKIDRSFVAGMGINGDDDAIVASIVSLSRAVGALCIAEGVETIAQHEALSALGCDLAQGYLFSRPVPAADLPAALAESDGRYSVAGGRGRRGSAGGATLDPEARRRIETLHQEGASLHTIAAALNRDGILTPGGGRWHSAAVAQVIAGTYRPSVRRRTRKAAPRTAPVPLPRPHDVTVCEGRELARSVADRVAADLATGQAAIVVATPEHRALIADELAAQGADVDALEKAGRFTCLDAATTLSRLTIDGYLSARLFRDVVESAVEAAVHLHGGVSIYGEMVGLLWADGEVATALALEDLWNDLATRLPFSLFCGYPPAALDEQGCAADLARMHAQHTSRV